jgi:hypothetical protein
LWRSTSGRRQLARGILPAAAKSFAKEQNSLFNWITHKFFRSKNCLKKFVEINLVCVFDYVIKLKTPTRLLTAMLSQIYLEMPPANPSPRGSKRGSAFMRRSSNSIGMEQAYVLPSTGVSNLIDFKVAPDKKKFFQLFQMNEFHEYIKSIFFFKKQVLFAHFKYFKKGCLNFDRT